MNLKILMVLAIAGIVTMATPACFSDTQQAGSVAGGGFCSVGTENESGRDKARPSTADTAKGKPQTTCPVLGGEINKSLYVDYQGKRIYVCCSDCIEAVKKNPEKYIKKLEEQGVTLENISIDKDSKEGKERTIEQKK